MKTVAIVLAAGKGTRMKSTLPKVCHPVCGKSMVQHVVNRLQEAGIEEIFVVVGHQPEEVKKAVKGNITFVRQEEQNGTGHAVQQVIPFLCNEEQNVLILTGDAPLITSETIEDVVSTHLQSGAKGTVVSVSVQNPTGYGRILQNETHQVEAIVEEKDATTAIRKITDINTGIFCVNSDWLSESVMQLTPNNVQNELYLTDIVAMFKQKGQPFHVYQGHDENEFKGVNDRIQLSEAEKVMQARINRRHMEEGVTMIDPTTVYIDEEVRIGVDTVVYPNVMIKGASIIGERCTIESGTHISHSTVGNNTTIKHSYVTDSRIGAKVNIGPFAHIRPDSVLGDKVKIGNFVEVKKSDIGNGSKVSHLSYIGDADIGEDVNIGCGTITVNYDGQNKYKTTIKDNAFVGCNANLMAPITIGENALVAAGSTVTEDVPKDALAIARSRQTNKEDYRK